MKGLFNKIVTAVGNVHWHYVRRFLPNSSPVYFNGIPTLKWRKYGDGLLPMRYRRQTLDRPYYETAICIGLRSAVLPGDHVVVVGGGRGITTALSAQISGPEGRVDLYEGSASVCDKIHQLLNKNSISDRVKIHHAIVGNDISVYPGERPKNVTSPEQIPECDVLELDCEGAETLILDGISFRPREIIVECHGLYGAPTDSVMKKLISMNYNVLSLGVAEVDKAQYCLSNDIMVLWARLVSRENMSV